MTNENNTTSAMTNREYRLQKAILNEIIEQINDIPEAMERIKPIIDDFKY